MKQWTWRVIAWVIVGFVAASCGKPAGNHREPVPVETQAPAPVANSPDEPVAPARPTQPAQTPSGPDKPSVVPGVTEFPPELLHEVMPAVQGVWVATVVPQTAAAAAGMQTGDILTAINGSTIRDFTHLRAVVGRFRAATTV